MWEEDQEEEEEEEEREEEDLLRKQAISPILGARGLYRVTPCNGRLELITQPGHPRVGIRITLLPPADAVMMMAMMMIIIIIIIPVPYTYMCLSPPGLSRLCLGIWNSPPYLSLCLIFPTIPAVKTPYAHSMYMYSTCTLHIYPLVNRGEAVFFSSPSPVSPAASGVQCERPDNIVVPEPELWARRQQRARGLGSGSGSGEWEREREWE